MAIVKSVKDGVGTFDKEKKTCLAVDWSKHGVGFLLLQKKCECAESDDHRCCQGGWVLVLAGGRFTKPAE